MNPLLQWILRHERGQWAAPATRQRYERLFPGSLAPPNPTPAQAREADRLWRSALGTAFHLDKVRNALLNVQPGRYISGALIGLMAGARGPIQIPVLATGIGPLGVPVATRIVVDVPAMATGAQMRQCIADAVAAAAPKSDVPYTSGIIMFGACPL